MNRTSAPYVLTRTMTREVRQVLDVLRWAGTVVSMQTRHFESYTAARTHLRGLLDAAHAGYVTTIVRERERYTVVDGDVLRAQLATLLPSRAVVAAEGGGWAAFLPGLPLSGEGDDLDGALDDLIEALREYAADWNERLLNAPNHRGNWALVTLTELSDDAQLKEWLLSSELSAAR